MLVGPVTRVSTQQLQVTSRGSVARCERGLLVTEDVGRVVDALETAAVSVEHADGACVGERGDLEDVVVGRRIERVEAERSVGAAHVHAIEPEGVEMRVQQQG